MKIRVTAQGRIVIPAALRRAYEDQVCLFPAIITSEQGANYGYTCVDYNFKNG